MRGMIGVANERADPMNKTDVQVYRLDPYSEKVFSRLMQIARAERQRTFPVFFLSSGVRVLVENDLVDLMPGEEDPARPLRVLQRFQDMSLIALMADKRIENQYTLTLTRSAQDLSDFLKLSPQQQHKRLRQMERAATRPERQLRLALWMSFLALLLAIVHILTTGAGQVLIQFIRSAFGLQ